VQAGEKWGSGLWQIAVSNHKANGTCKCHANVFNGRVCKTSVSIGRSGLSVGELQLRLKRWLIAGLDSDTWNHDAGDLQEQHVGMGGTFLEDLSNGLTEADCDRIANAQ